MADKKSSGSTALIVIIVIATLFLFGKCSAADSNQKEREAFSNQLNKDPSGWTQEEKNRYNAFVEWKEEQ